MCRAAASPLPTWPRRAITHVDIPEGLEPGLEFTHFYDPPGYTFPFGTHACIVEVDAETGQVEITRYVAVDDCGTAINPKLVDGQVHGGLAQGIAQALYEEIVFDPENRPATHRVADGLRGAQGRDAPQFRDRPDRNTHAE